MGLRGAGGDLEGSTVVPSTDSDEFVRNTPSTNSKRRESRQAVKGLVEHFSNFTSKIHDASERNVMQLKEEVFHSELLVRHGLDREIDERARANSALEKRCEALERAVQALQGDQESGDDCSPLSQRVDYLENMFGSWADTHTRNVNSLRKGNEKLARDLAALSEAHAQHLSVEASLDASVKGLTVTAEQTAQALAGAVKGLTSNAEQMFQDLAMTRAELEEMRDSVPNSARRCAAGEDGSAALLERLKESERWLDGGMQKCLAEVEKLRGDHGKLAVEVKQWRSATEDRISHVAASHKESLDAAVDYLASNTDQTARALAAATSELDRVRDGARGCEQRCAAVEGHSASLAQHLRDAEQRLEDSISFSFRELESLKGDHMDLSLQVAQKLAEALQREPARRRGSPPAAALHSADSGGRRERGLRLREHERPREHERGVRPGRWPGSSLSEASEAVAPRRAR